MTAAERSKAKAEQESGSRLRDDVEADPARSDGIESSVFVVDPRAREVRRAVAAGRAADQAEVIEDAGRTGRGPRGSHAPSR